METNTSLNDDVNIFVDIDGICKRGATMFDSCRKFLIATGTALMQRHQLFRDNISARYRVICLLPKGLKIRNLLVASLFE